jgi:hypothetical protein
MEGSMDNETSGENYKFDSDLPRKLEFENRADATGFWFAAAVLFAVLAAAIIVYRAGDSDYRMASNEVAPAAAQSDPIAAPPILPRR